MRGVSRDAPCRVCFQPGKDVMVPGHPGLIDYPQHGTCERLGALRAYGAEGAPRSRAHRPQLLFGGAVWTVPQGPGFYESSRLVMYLCHKNGTHRGAGYSITQTETQPESVRPWEVERGVDLLGRSRHADFCVVPDGKIGGYGHRAIAAIMLGCVPVLSKELYSHELLDEAIDWAAISLRVPPAQMPRLPAILGAADAEAMRRAAGGLRRRLLWASIYGGCHLAPAEGGAADAFDTLMAVLAKPRRHFALLAEHRAPRAPELRRDLDGWLRERGGARCAPTAPR